MESVNTISVEAWLALGERLQNKIAVLRTALRVFGVHMDDCSYFDKEIATCNCGLAEALSE